MPVKYFEFDFNIDNPDQPLTLISTTPPKVRKKRKKCVLKKHRKCCGACAYTCSVFGYDCVCKKCASYLPPDNKNQVPPNLPI